MVIILLNIYPCINEGRYMLCNIHTDVHRCNYTLHEHSYVGLTHDTKGLYVILAKHVSHHIIKNMDLTLN